MVSGHIFHCRKNSWPAEEYVGRTALQLVSPLFGSCVGESVPFLVSCCLLLAGWSDVLELPSLQLDFDGGAPPEQAWRRRLNSHANILKEFSVTFMEAMRMVWTPRGSGPLCWAF